MPAKADEKVAELPKPTHKKRFPSQEGVLVGDGLTILQTHTIEDANALMQTEPLDPARFETVRSAAMGTP
jgi:hypothetical protein